MIKLNSLQKYFETMFTFYGGGGQSGGSSTTQQNIPKELKPLATAYSNKAMNLGNQGFKPYTGNRFAGFNQAQMLGLGKVMKRALGGSQTMRNAEAGLNQFIQGGQTNPYLDKMVGKAQGSVSEQFNNMVKPQTESAMQQSGSFGNSGYQQLMQNQQKAAGQQMSDIATNMYGGAYDQDQSRKMQAIGMADSFGNAEYRDAGQLLQAGGMQQDQAQQDMDFGYQQWQDAQNLDYKQLAAMAGVFNSNLGGSSTTSQSGGGGK